MKFKYYFLFFVVLCCLVFSVCCVTLAISKEKTLIIEKEAKHKISIDMPREWNERLSGLLESKIGEIRENFLDVVSTDHPMDKVYTLDITYQRTLYEEYISYCFVICTYTGGAHPNTSFFTIVYDTLEGKVLDLSDYNLEVISKNVRGDLLMNPKIIQTDFLMSGTEPALENFQHFIFIEEGILFFFPPYQVGPYSSGTFESLVSWEKLL